MKKGNAPRLVIIAAIAGIITVFIARSNEEPSQCFTWKVEINKSTFYLAGSIHAAKEADYPLPDAYTKAYKKAKRVIFELEDDFETLENKIFLYAEKDRLPDGISLRDSLHPETINKLKVIIENDKLGKSFGYEAWLLNMFIAGRKYILTGYDPKLGVDRYFHTLAIKDKKEIIGLDEIETQLALFDFDLPFRIQIQVIEKAVSEMEVKAEAEEELFKAYFENNMEKFEEEFLKPYDFKNPQMKNVYDMVFTKRNASWVEKLIRLSNDNPGSYFVVVGSGHFFGPGNILELLNSKDYHIEKI